MTETILCYAMMLFFRQKKKQIGELGEDYAVAFLRKKGYKILARNWYNPKGKRLGEIDIIAEKDAKLIFVEVKTRDVSGDLHVTPEEQITRMKLQKLQRAAEFYVKQQNLWNQQWQFDAVSVHVCDKKMVKIDHLENIFL
ncbi:MAG: hypothetical protein CR972_03220 [Candidatus Moraniibacteriota bacterium]|nr:MAG: hypothetical protein CR972_03220 [Candidatus Moranbacteria bacterium]